MSVQPPTADQPIGFDEHIKPLFREGDRQSMRFAFDLWSHADVSRHADAILERLEDGTMPCDEAWPGERVELFKRNVLARPQVRRALDRITGVVLIGLGVRLALEHRA